MQYRDFGKTGIQVSTFGFGCMRLPMTGEKIDEAEAIAMIRYAAENGVNYFDTAYPYHAGKSELVLGKALTGGYREKIQLATKLPSWYVHSKEDLDRFLDEQLQKLQTDHIDFYLLHALDSSLWPKLRDLGVREFLDAAKKSGRIRHAGFSFHDELPVFKEIIDAYDWNMCQIQLNFMDVHYQAGMEGLEYAAARGIPAVIMEPLRGGNLARNVPEDARRIWEEGQASSSPAEWAFRWLGNIPQVKVVLSGVSTMEQLKDTIRIFEGALPHSLSAAALERYDRVKEIYERRLKVGCTACHYCMPCPSGVNIPDVFRLYNDTSLFGSINSSKFIYTQLKKSGSDASVCVECASCESACPQHIDIIQKLKDAHAVLSGK
ncbi:MAG: aldo/keto reductase [Clostridia bacterium]|nr:aldo/keto reductase [Clostridia bacterium]